MDMQAAISRLIMRLGEAWDRQDYARMRREFWDPEEAEPWYVPEEVAEPLIGWQAIEQYWATNRRIMRCVRVRYSDIRVKPVAGHADQAVALFALRWDAELKDWPAPLGGFNRVTANLRLTGDGWRLTHYIEAPMAPITYIRTLVERHGDTAVDQAMLDRIAALYQADTLPEFEEFRRAYPGNAD